MFRQRKGKQQLTYAVATCPNCVPMHCQCHAASWCLNATSDIASCCHDATAASWCPSAAANIVSDCCNARATSWFPNTAACAIKKKSWRKRWGKKISKQCKRKIIDLCNGCHPVKATTINNQPVCKVSRGKVSGDEVLFAIWQEIVHKQRQQSTCEKEKQRKTKTTFNLHGGCQLPSGTAKNT